MKHVTIATCALIVSTSVPYIALAEDFDDRSRVAAEAWRKVDELFFDRTFNGQDWFQLRQKLVKKHYTSDSELFANLKQVFSQLGDKYTRYLTPAQVRPCPSFPGPDRL